MVQCVTTIITKSGVVKVLQGMHEVLDKIIFRISWRTGRPEILSISPWQSFIIKPWNLTTIGTYCISGTYCIVLYFHIFVFLLPIIFIYYLSRETYIVLIIYLIYYQQGYSYQWQITFWSNYRWYLIIDGLIGYFCQCW